MALTVLDIEIDVPVSALAALAGDTDTLALTKSLGADVVDVLRVDLNGEERLVFAKYSAGQPRDTYGRFSSYDGFTASGDFTAARKRGMADPEWDATTPVNPDGQSTGHRHGVAFDEDGEAIEYSAERQALHEQIVEDIVMSVPESKNPTAIMLGGGTASGKSSGLEHGLVGQGEKGTYVQIDADGIKERLPEYRALARAGDASLASFAHEESSHISKLVQKRALEMNRDILFDGTGDSGIDRLERKVGVMRDAGYRVDARYSTVPIRDAIARSDARARKPLEGVPNATVGRWVAPTILVGTHVQVSRVLPQAMSRNPPVYDSVRLIDTNVPRGTSPRVILDSPDGTLARATIHDPGAWESFKAKDPDYVSKAMLPPPPVARRLTWWERLTGAHGA